MQQSSPLARTQAIALIVRRLLREFWLPALVAVGWTGFNAYSNSNWSLRSIINVFAPSFFLASWATGQFFRVQKQVGLDTNLKSLETRLTALVERFEQHATDFLGYSTGGDSWACFLPVTSGGETVELMLRNKSRYPVFDIHARAIDVDEPIDVLNRRLWTEHFFSLPHIYPNMVYQHAYRFDLTGRDHLNLNIFINSRSGAVTQEFRIARTDGRFVIAFRTTAGDKVDVQVPANFPGLDPANPTDIFSTS